MKHRYLVLAFIPAILLVFAAVAFRMLQYNTLQAQNTRPDQNEEVIQIPIFPNDHIIGDKKAPITLIAFEDLGCSSCAIQDQILSQLIEQHPDKIKIVWKPLSVNTIPFPTRLAHEYAYCADKQGLFEPFKTLAFVNHINLSPEILDLVIDEVGLDRDKLDTCVASGEATTHALLTEQLAQALNIQAVPAIFVNNVQVDYPTTVSGWETLLGL